MSKIADIDSIDQILAKIKRAINEDTKKLNSQKNEEVVKDANKDPEVLELTNVITKTKPVINHEAEEIIDQENFDLISEHVQNFTHKLNTLMQGNYIVSEKEVREIFKETLRPYLKSWLNNNLQDIVKEILETEVRKIFKKII